MSSLSCFVCVVAVFQTDGRGFGLVAKEDIAEGSLVIEYCGEMITDEECTRRLNETQITGNKEYYFFKIDDNLVRARNTSMQAEQRLATV